MLSAPKHHLDEMIGKEQWNAKHPYDVRDSEPLLFTDDPLGQDYRNHRYTKGEENPEQPGKIIGTKIVMDHISGLIHEGTATAQPIHNEPLVYKAVRNC